MHRFIVVLAVFALLASAGAVSADDTDVQHVKIDMEVFTTSKTISATTTHTVKSAKNGLVIYDLRLYRSLTVSAVKVNGQPANYTRPTDAIQVTLDKTYNIGQSFTVAVTYSGAPASLFYGSFVFGTHGSPRVPVVWSLSEPWYAYSWWACKESTSDKFTFECWLTVPSGQQALANGLSQGKDVLSGNRERFRWKTDYPLCTYAVAVAISNYRRRTDTYKHMGANMPVEFWVYPEYYSSSSQQAGMNQLVPMLTTFSNLWGQYPFVKEQYGICQCGFGGGMEHQTLTFQGSFSSENLNAHELAHSWWGNMITCATWKDIWLNEGFATYGEALWKEWKTGSSNKAALRSHMASRRPSAVSDSVYCYNDTSASRIFSSTYSYNKGSWVVHQLRGVVGDTMFFKILSDYRAVKAYQSATTQEFNQIASLAYGQDLTWFFDQCVMKGGAPSYDWAWVVRAVGGKPYLMVTVEQTQASKSYGLFKFPVEIRADSTTHRVTNDHWKDEFVVPLTTSPSSVSFDPDNWILRETIRNVTFRQSLASSATTVSAATGGTVNLTINAGARLANRPYLIGGSLSGISPGIALPGTPEPKVLPLVFDNFTQAILASLNVGSFRSFAGLLDWNGRGAATLSLPRLGSAAVGVEAYFAWLTVDAPYFTSIPVSIKVAP